MGRPKKAGKRTKSGRLSRSCEALGERLPPNDKVLALRERFAWHRPTGDGKVANIDADVCDGIGQLHACGLLEGADPIDMRDRGREWGCHLAKLLKPVGMKTQTYERQERGHGESPYTGADYRFDKMDGVLSGIGRQLVGELCLDPLLGDRDIPMWAQELVAERLKAKGIATPGMVGPTLGDKAKLAIVNDALTRMSNALGGKRVANAA